MKKFVSITAAFGLMAAMATAVAADPATTTSTTTNSPSVSNVTYSDSSVTNSVYAPAVSEPIVKPDNVVNNPTIPVVLTKTTMFYSQPHGMMLGALAAQKLNTTGEEWGDPSTGERWVEVYTWKGTAWIRIQ
ncbi:hypothetical protein Q5741_15645 [Paenibacillus sp. JX-17]|uniref:SH3 domain-containing protein n=1 Tax=Paenibacillus lacisoli TaxID=3064525 RepID=A0ABT9CEZ4_9BACL|nr:hypothetical protein [Paenibacillus sp. JX-17]MDO7907845.1 hypothetical protein [Paenibacillus sp. JX-17]